MLAIDGDARVHREALPVPIGSVVGPGETARRRLKPGIGTASA